MLRRCTIWQHQDETACLQNPTPARIDRLKGRQHPRALRLRSSHSICATALYHQPKCIGQHFEPLGAGVLFSLNKNCRLLPDPALTGIASVCKVMSNQSWSDGFHIGKEKW